MLDDWKLNLIDARAAHEALATKIDIVADGAD
jgi:hypothetical protein